MTVIHQVPKTDVIAILKTPNPENFKNMRLEMGLVSISKPFYLSKIDSNFYKNYKPQKHNNPGIMQHLPSIAMDNRSYYLRLNSVNQQSPEIAHVFYFTANTSFRSFEINYNPNLNSSDNIKQTSKLTFVFLILFMFIIYNINKVAACFTDFSKTFYNKLIMNNRREVLPDSPIHTSDIDDLVQNINAPQKKKPKPRKV